MLLAMGLTTDADPLAVRTMTAGGEEMAFSDPFVSDAQRAAAGRETVAERMRALLPANRTRGAAAYASGGLAGRGSRAPAVPAERPLAGEVRSHTLESAALRGPREVTVYVPPDAGGRVDRVDLRSQEYLPRHRPRRFAAHLSFVIDEVI